MNNPQIKSKSRVRDHGEVYTKSETVNAMLDLIPADDPARTDLTAVYLEPACGNGNMLVKIYRRKLELCHSIADGVLALASIYGVDILLDNVQESKARLWGMFKARFGVDPDFPGMSVDVWMILNSHIMWGDTLTGRREADGKQIWFLPPEAYKEEKVKSAGEQIAELQELIQKARNKAYEIDSTLAANPFPWVPVEERLPEVSEKRFACRCIVAYISEQGNQWTDDAIYNKLGWHGTKPGLNLFRGKVTHWMYYPEYPSA